MSCTRCGNLLFWEYGDGDELCANCREREEWDTEVVARDRAMQPIPGQPWAPVRGRIGGTGFEACPAHGEPEPCPTCASYIAAGL